MVVHFSTKSSSSHQRRSRGSLGDAFADPEPPPPHGEAFAEPGPPRTRSTGEALIAEPYPTARGNPGVVMPSDEGCEFEAGIEAPELLRRLGSELSILPWASL